MCLCAAAISILLEYQNSFSFAKHVLIEVVFCFFSRPMHFFIALNMLFLVYCYIALHTKHVHNFPFSLGVEPVDRDVMKRPPRKASNPMITKFLLLQVISSAFLIVLGTLFIFWREVRLFGYPQLRRKPQNLPEALLFYFIKNLPHPCTAGFLIWKPNP